MKEEASLGCMSGQPNALCVRIFVASHVTDSLHPMDEGLCDGVIAVTPPICVCHTRSTHAHPRANPVSAGLAVVGQCWEREGVLMGMEERTHRIPSAPSLFRDTLRLMSHSPSSPSSGRC